MQERTALEDQLTAIARIEQELDDQMTMIDLGAHGLPISEVRVQMSAIR